MIEETQPQEIVSIETGFKLYKDFGVRALIASLSIIGFLVITVVTISSNNTDVLDKISVMWMPVIVTIINFYFLGSIMRDMKK
jgi:hypothetical protein